MWGMTVGHPRCRVLGASTSVTQIAEVQVTLGVIHPESHWGVSPGPVPLRVPLLGDEQTHLCFSSMLAIPIFTTALSE